MNAKKGKNQQPLRPGNTVLDSTLKYKAGDERTWLVGTLGLDANTRRSQQRAIAAEVFLQTCLFPLAEAGRQPDESNMVDLLAEFKRSRRDLDNGFEMAQVSARLLNRFQCYVLDDPDPEAPMALGFDSVQRELELFTSLASLDFQFIDTAVSERLHSG